MTLTYSVLKGKNLYVFVAALSPVVAALSPDDEAAIMGDEAATK